MLLYFYTIVIMTNTMKTPVIRTYKIVLKTWLHIGGSGDSLKIGGIDSEVVKNPLTWAPYIPGSSIKGRMRALLEMVDYSRDLEEVSGGTIGLVSNPESLVARAFGCSTKTLKLASKLIFEDFALTDEYQQKFEKLWSDFYEDKAENTVPRFLKGSANPRHMERVPAGVEFEGRIIIIPEEGEYWASQSDLESILDRGIELLEATFLWGGGSRWNGRVIFEKIDW